MFGICNCELAIQQQSGLDSAPYDSGESKNTWIIWYRMSRIKFAHSLAVARPSFDEQKRKGVTVVGNSEGTETETVKVLEVDRCLETLSCPDLKKFRRLVM